MWRDVFSVTLRVLWENCINASYSYNNCTEGKLVTGTISKIILI